MCYKLFCLKFDSNQEIVHDFRLSMLEGRMIMKSTYILVLLMIGSDLSIIIQNVLINCNNHEIKRHIPEIKHKAHV